MNALPVCRDSVDCFSGSIRGSCGLGKGVDEGM